MADSPAPKKADSPYLIVGLRNPGSKYADTRHNIGSIGAFLAARELSPTPSFSLQKKLRVDLCSLRTPEGNSVIVALPTTFMNESGMAVSAVAKYYSVPLTQIIVLHDELDIEFGQTRLKRGGGEGGHNGLRSISTHLGTKDYLRVRMGIGRPPGRMDAASYVLKPFSQAERTELPLNCQEAAEAALLLTTHDLSQAQNIVHARSA